MPPSAGEDHPLTAKERLRAGLGGALDGPGGPRDAADRLCRACVDLLHVDGAAVSLVLGGTSRGTFGASDVRSRRADELQSTLGEGPCLDAVRSRRPVLVDDLDDPGRRQWPALTEQLLGVGVQAVFALPVAVEAEGLGALDLYRDRSGQLSADDLWGALHAAELAAGPLRDLASGEGPAGGDPDGQDALALGRVEVYQATGMVMGATGVDADEALARLRAHAFTRGVPVGELALSIVERRLTADAEAWDERR